MPLTATERRLLSFLAAKPGMVQHREAMIQHLAGQGAGGNRGVDVHIVHLRSKLKGGTAVPPAIVAVRGFGYKIMPVGELADAATADPREHVVPEPNGVAQPPPRASSLRRKNRNRY